MKFFNTIQQVVQKISLKNPQNKALIKLKILYRQEDKQDA